MEEYLALDEQSETKYEFFDGEIFAMAGADISHNLISGKFYVNFRQTVRGRSCKVVMEGVQLAVQEGHHYTYPHVMKTGDPDDQRATRILHAPVLLIEVLSKFTEIRDRS